MIDDFVSAVKCLVADDIQIEFANDQILTIFCNFEISDGNTSAKTKQEEEFTPEVRELLCCLIGQTVNSVQNTINDNKLTITFKNGSKLTLYSCNDQYIGSEAYTFQSSKLEGILSES